MITWVHGHLEEPLILGVLPSVVNVLGEVVDELAEAVEPRDFEFDVAEGRIALRGFRPWKLLDEYLGDDAEGQ
jgi:hypothetical protein